MTLTRTFRPRRLLQPPSAPRAVACSKSDRSARDRRRTSRKARIAKQRRRSGTPPQGNSQDRIATLASMARTENDTWDLATSVGATATMVAAGRGRAPPAGLLREPDPQPLGPGGGGRFLPRWANGELSADEV